MMARRKPVEPSPDEVAGLPHRELLRFVPPQPAPKTEDGRPMPWAVKWTAADFAAWLRARAAWRETHAEPLPGLLGRERVALNQMDLPPALVRAEREANEARKGGSS
ncbi:MULTISPECIES: hypothetical protein [unclassified Blastococcus]|uniref:hypothetical protein n=1 Tax=unclassified Blastococcus TaxID=2619396 RepID=UPI001EF02F93|nr:MULTISPECIES: hypothetical protein [unclassified Blastococcus]